MKFIQFKTWKFVHAFAFFALGCFLQSCQSSCDKCAPKISETEEVESENDDDLPNAIVWLESTALSYNPYQPWDSVPVEKKYAYGTVLSDGRIITVSSLVEFANYIEVQSADKEYKTKAEVVYVDYELNLALLEVDDSEFLEHFEGVEVSDYVLQEGDEVSFLGFNEDDELEYQEVEFEKYVMMGQMVPGVKALGTRFTGKLDENSWQIGMPVLHEGELLGLLNYNNSSESESETNSSQVLNFFASQMDAKTPESFPTIGVSTSMVTDKPLLQWLELPESLEGVGRYITKVIKGGAADKAGLKPSDFLVEIDGWEITKEGKVEHDVYGEINWSAVLKDGARKLGDQVMLKVYREGELLELKLELNRDSIEQRVVGVTRPGEHAKYLVYGGFIFRELDTKYYNIFGNDWRKRAPIKLLSALNYQDRFPEEVKGAVVLSFSLQTPSTISYEGVHHAMVEKVNGKQVKSFEHFVQLVEEAASDTKLIRIDIDHPTNFLILNPATCNQVNEALKQRGLLKLKRL